LGLCCSSKGVTLLYVELLSKLCETIFALLDTPSAAPQCTLLAPSCHLFFCELRGSLATRLGDQLQRSSDDDASRAGGGFLG